MLGPMKERTASPIGVGGRLSRWLPVLGWAALIFALSCLLVALWLTMSEPKSKLYEADNMVCASQPLATNCWERKPR